MIVLANPPSKKHGIPNFQFSKRVKFTMKRQKVKRLLVELDTCNRRLDTFANKAEKPEEQYKAEKKSKFALPLYLIKENATRLYERSFSDMVPRSSFSSCWLTTRTTSGQEAQAKGQPAKRRKMRCQLLSDLITPKSVSEEVARCRI